MPAAPRETALTAPPLSGTPLPPEGLYLLLLVAACALVGLLALMATAVTGLPTAVALALPFVLAAGVVLVYDTRVGLCAVAFAIPLTGVFQAEVFGITLNLSELLVFALAAKETVRLLSRPASLDLIVPPWAFLIYLAFSLWAVVTGLRGGWPARAVLQDFRQFTEFVVLFLLIVLRVGTPGLARAMLASFVLGGCLIAAHGILQRFTGLGIPINQLMNDLVFHQGIRSGSFYGATTLGGLMVLVGGAALGLLLSSRHLPERALWLGLLGACVTAAVYTNTRASWLAFAISFGVVFLFVRKTPFVLAVAIGGGAIVAAVLGALIVQRMQKLAFTKAERSLLERLNYYTVAWHIFRSHPVFGLGYGCFYELKPILANDRYIAVPFDPAAPPPTVHSAYLQILVKTGLVGLTTFLLFLATWFRQMLSTLRSRSIDERTFNLFLPVTAALLGYLFHAAFENFFQWPVMAQSFWLLLGLSLALSATLTGKPATKAEP